MTIRDDSDLDRAAAFRRERSKHSREMQKSPRRAYSLLRAAIRNGELPAQSKLDEQDLIDRLRTSRNAVRLALKKLDADGLVERRPGAGTVVVGEIRQYPIFECAQVRTGNSSSLKLIETCDVPTSAYLAARFGSEIPSLRMSEFLIQIDGRAVGLFSRFGLDPAPVLEQPSPVLPPAHTSWYRRIHGQAPGDVHVVIEATMADDRTSRLLGVEEGYPLLVRETLYRDHLHQPAELHISHFDSRKAALVATQADIL